ncbi:MAG TPA: ATPase, partial [Lachnoclostridium sp.]
MFDGKIAHEQDLSLEQMKQMSPEEYVLVDVRDQTAYNHGFIPGALNIEKEALLNGDTSLPRDKKIILYCLKGIISEEAAVHLSEKGYEAYNLRGGYGEWLLRAMEKEDKGKERLEEIEKSIRKKFHKELFSRFAKAVNEYELVKENDRIAVCISGGKDSMLMAKLFQELRRHNKFPFELVFLVMDPGYNETNRQVIESNAKLLDIPITVF